MANLFDARDYKIPNELILLGYTAGLFLNIQAFQWVGVLIFIIKATLPILIMMLLYYFKGIGAGDIKMFSVMSSLVGIELTADVMLVSVILAGITVISLFIYEKKINFKRRLHYTFYMTGAFLLLHLTDY